MLWTRYDVFISYSREDVARVQPLVDELRRRGYRAFFDVESIVVGDKWKGRLERSICDSRALVLCWSEHARDSGYVNFEYSRAEVLHKPVLPWLLDQTPLPPMVEIQGISAVEATQVAAALQPQLGWTLGRRHSLQGLVAALLVAVLMFVLGRGLRPAPPAGSDVTTKEKVSVSSSGESSTPSATVVASKAKTALPRPDKPSIAVLPFVNVSGDKEQEYFSDGLTDEIINAVSKLRNLFVIARDSTFSYKGKSVKAQQVAEEMGVQYVLEGSVRKTGNKVRVTAQLVDALSGHELMSERYERDLKDIFALQDEIAMKVLSAMRVVLSEGEMARLTAKDTKNLDAYLKAMQASQLRWVINKQNLAMAKKLAEEAIALDPKYAWPYAVIAQAFCSEVLIGQYKNPREALAKAKKYGERAVALDDSSGYAHSALSLALVMNREYDRAISEAQRAVDLEPGSAHAMFHLGACLSWAGQYEQSLPLLKRSLRLSPVPIPMCVTQLAFSYRMLGQYQESIVLLKELTQREPDALIGRFGLAASYMLAGKEAEARAEAAEVLRINPNFSLEQYANSHPMKDRTLLRDRLIEPLRKAGLK
jgi:adenylate cyclase